MDAARFLEVYDIELILSWTPHEFKLLLKGSQHRQVDQYEYMAKSAMAHAYAANAKRATADKIFNAKRAHSLIDKGEQKPKMNKDRIRKLTEALKGFQPDFRKKGG